MFTSILKGVGAVMQDDEQEVPPTKKKEYFKLFPPGVNT